MSTPTPSPQEQPPLGDLFNDRRRRPTVYADQVAKGKVQVTGPATAEHPDGWFGTGVRQGSRWHVEDEHSEKYGKARNAKHVGEVLAHMHGHEPGSFDVQYTKEDY